MHNVNRPRPSIKRLWVAVAAVARAIEQREELERAIREGRAKIKAEVEEVFRKHRESLSRFAESTPADTRTALEKKLEKIEALARCPGATEAEREAARARQRAVAERMRLANINTRATIEAEIRQLTDDRLAKGEAVRQAAKSNGNGPDPVPGIYARLAAAIDEAPSRQQAQTLPYYVEQLIADLPARKERGRPGLSTGLPTVDRLTGGLREGMLFAIAASTGVGKSLMAMNIALDAKVPTVLFSLEMAGIEVAERMIAAAAGVNALRLQRGSVPDVEKLRETAREYARIWIDDRPAPSVAEIAATARALCRREAVELVIVDYLQIVRTEHDERREAEVASIARGLRSMARQLSVPVIALAQLNRSGDVRDSAVIEHEAHVVAVFDRKKRAETATFDIRKNRHGPEQCVALRMDLSTLRLREEEQRR